MRALIRIVLALIALRAAAADAAPRVVYRGMLQGAGEVVMELDRRPAADGTISGRYFYTQYGVDIPLHGQPAQLVEPLERTALPDEVRDMTRNSGAPISPIQRQPGAARGTTMAIAASGPTRVPAKRGTSRCDASPNTIPMRLRPAPSKPSPIVSPAASAAASQAARPSTCGRRRMRR
nr:hypothetical protein [Burkholderia ambifaria]